MLNFKKIIGILLLLGMNSSLLFAGTTGKISGKILDKETGKPLPGANVMIENSSYGAAADEKGQYFIINIPPGVYNIKATMIGYSASTKQLVQVITDMTTKLEFKLSTVALQADAVTVIAERPAIQKDLTSSLQAYGGDEIANAPVDNLNQVLEVQSGISSAEDEERASIVRDSPSDGLHIRGGRENETAFLVDGIRVDNPIWGGAEYVKNTSGSTVSEMTTILGTFNAEYGGKMSGVVNLVTRDGADRFELKASAYTDKIGLEAYDRNTFQGDITLSGPATFIPNLSYYVNFQTRTTDGRYTGYFLDDWTDSKGTTDIYDENGNNLGTEVSLGWKESWNGMAKLVWKPFGKLKLMGSYIQSHVQETKYYHEYLYMPYSMPWRDTESKGYTLKSSYQFSPRTFAELTGSIQTIDYWMGIHKTREQRLLMGSRYDEPVYGFYYSGAYQNYWVDSTQTYQLAGSITSQTTQIHQFKVGFDYRYLDIFHRLDNAWDSPYEIVQYEDDDGNPAIAEFRSHKAYSNAQPIESAAYIQDKMEFDEIGMIINLGLRIEQWDIGKKYMEDPTIPMETPLLDTEAKVRISPRLGVSYPISDHSAFHFAYGHFYQFPSYVDLLSGVNEESIYGDRPNTDEVGLAVFNPNINPEKSVTYEAGIQTSLFPDLTMNFTIYYREMADLVGVTWIKAAAGYVYFDNVDFGNSKGLEVTLNKRMTNKFSARFNYSLSQTLVSTSSPLNAAQSDEIIAYRSQLADWDRTHNLAGFATMIFPAKVNVTLKASMKSGKPYTILAEKINTERKPWNINFSLKIKRNFYYFQGRQQIYFQILNLFDRENVYSIYPRTGLWDDDGDPATPAEQDADPRRVSDGRRIRFGIALSL